jgi:hypothetical protein
MAGDLGLGSWHIVDIFSLHSIQTNLWDPLTLLYSSYWGFSVDIKQLALKLITHIFSVEVKNGAVLQLPLHLHGVILNYIRDICIIIC